VDSPHPYFFQREADDGLAPMVSRSTRRTCHVLRLGSCSAAAAGAMAAAAGRPCSLPSSPNVHASEAFYGSSWSDP
jgi:hypothetical protein